MQSIYNAIDSGQYDAAIVILVYQATRNRTESRLCKAFIMATYPVVWDRGKVDGEDRETREGGVQA